MKNSFLSKWAGALLLAAAVFALAALVAFGSQGRQSDWGWGFAILGFLSLGGWFLGRRGEPRLASDKYSRQRVLLGANAVLSVLLLLVLLVGVNYIAARRHKVFDLTKNRINSLAPQTVKALAALKTPVKFTYVWAPSDFAPQIDPSAQSVLEAYQNAGEKVRVEYVNALQEPLKFQSLGLPGFSGQPVLLVAKTTEEKSGGNSATNVLSGNAPPSARQEIAVVDEQNITSALLKIADPKPRVLYFLSGHGEQLPTPGSGAQMNAARNALEAQNYTLKTLLLAGAKAQIPTDAAAVIALAPQVDLSPAEEQKLKRYANGAGRLGLFFTLARRPTPRWKSLARSLNVEMLDGIVLELDPQRSGGNPQIVAGLIEDATRHPILRGVSGAVLFPGVVPLRALPAAPPASLNLTTLFESSINSNSLTTTGNRLRQTGEGPFLLAAAIEKASAPAAPSAGGLRAIVAGNASFATDGPYNQFGNGSFFLGAINWLVGNDALISIPPKQPVTNTINLTDATRNFIILFSLVALPAGVLLLGTVVWWKRR